MEIIEKLVDELVPYENNPRDNDEAVEYVANSIRDFGFKVPIVIDRDNVVVCGHTRLKASKLLGLKSVPCVVASDLSDSQIKAFRLADNKVAEKAQWDYSKLELELNDLELDDIDMEDYGFLFLLDDDNNQDEDKENERVNTVYQYNLHLYDPYDVDGMFQMPVIHNDGIVPKVLKGFNYALSSKEKDFGLHFFLDDYQFERLWRAPEQYLDILKEYQCVLSPDFSLYMNMPLAMKIWNVYRSRLLGHWWQEQGLIVIPTISWAEADTFSFCFDGIPQGSIVAVSTIGVKKQDDAFRVWKNGMDAMIEKIHPKIILVYGGKLEYEYPQDIEVVYYENEVTERMKNYKEVEYEQK